MAWQKNGTPDTLGSAGDVLEITDLTALIFNVFLGHIVARTSTTLIGIRFNNNSNSVYADRTNVNGGTDATLTSQDEYIIHISTSDDEFNISNSCWIGDEEKLTITHQVHAANPGASNAPNRAEYVNKFVPSPDADLSEFSELNSSFPGDYGIDSNISALGTD